MQTVMQLNQRSDIISIFFKVQCILTKWKDRPLVGIYTIFVHMHAFTSHVNAAFAFCV